MVLPVYSDSERPVQGGAAKPVYIVNASEISHSLNTDLAGIQSSLDEINADVSTLQTTVNGVKSETDTINDVAGTGLLGKKYSLSYRTSTVERHFHNYERWLGMLAVPSGGKVADPNTFTPFTLTSGNGAGLYGTAVQVMNTNDTPLQTFLATPATYFDIHRIFILNVSTNGRTWRIRTAMSNDLHGNTYASYAAAVAGGAYTDTVLKVDQTNNDAVPVNMFFGRLPAKTLVWMNIAQSGAGVQTIEVMFGLHEYPGE